MVDSMMRFGNRPTMRAWIIHRFFDDISPYDGFGDDYAPQTGGGRDGIDEGNFGVWSNALNPGPRPVDPTQPNKKLYCKLNDLAGNGKAKYGPLVAAGYCPARDPKRTDGDE